MSDIPTPETDAAWDKYTSPPYTYWAGDLRILAQRLERERDEARTELEEYRSIAEKIGATKAVSERDKAVAERDGAREQNAKLSDIAERALNNTKLGLDSIQRENQLRAELDQLKEVAK